MGHRQARKSQPDNLQVHCTFMLYWGDQAAKRTPTCNPVAWCFLNSMHVVYLFGTLQSQHGVLHGTRASSIFVNPVGLFGAYCKQSGPNVVSVVSPDKFVWLCPCGLAYTLNFALLATLQGTLLELVCSHASGHDTFLQQSMQVQHSPCLSYVQLLVLHRGE